jgi:hypothetical protein
VSSSLGDPCVRAEKVSRRLVTADEGDGVAAVEAQEVAAVSTATVELRWPVSESSTESDLSREERNFIDKPEADQAETKISSLGERFGTFDSTWFDGFGDASARCCFCDTDDDNT